MNWGAAGENPLQERELLLIRPTEFSGKETKDPNNWLERYNRIANANKWSMMRRYQIIGGYLTGAAAKWYDTVKNLITTWNGAFGFENAFLGKFASVTRRNTWYMKYKTCK